MESHRWLLAEQTQGVRGSMRCSRTFCILYGQQLMVKDGGRIGKQVWRHCLLARRLVLMHVLEYYLAMGPFLWSAASALLRKRNIDDNGNRSDPSTSSKDIRAMFIHKSFLVPIPFQFTSIPLIVILDVKFIGVVEKTLPLLHAKQAGLRYKQRLVD